MRLDANYIKRYNLTEEEIKITMSGYVPMQVKAHDYFLKEGQVCNHIGFVTRGVLRSYFYDDLASEITTEFYPEGSLVISFDSFNNRMPSQEYIKAIEDSELMVISWEKQKELYEILPVWNQICKELADKASQELFERTKNFQVLSATERYEKFCTENRDLLNRVSLGQIASYIGVDIATLSRIRKKK